MSRAPAVSLDELRTEARYRRDRCHLYRARTYGPRETSAARLRELDQAHRAAEARLRHAESELAADA